jgi:hypothetical protein
MICKIWYSISQTVSDLGNVHDRSIRPFAVKPRLRRATKRLRGLTAQHGRANLLPVPPDNIFCGQCLTGGVLVFSDDQLASRDHFRSVAAVLSDQFLRSVGAVLSDHDRRRNAAVTWALRFVRAERGVAVGREALAIKPGP